MAYLIFFSGALILTSVGLGTGRERPYGISMPFWACLGFYAAFDYGSADLWADWRGWLAALSFVACFAIGYDLFWGNFVSRTEKIKEEREPYYSKDGLEFLEEEEYAEEQQKRINRRKTARKESNRKEEIKKQIGKRLRSE